MRRELWVVAGVESGANVASRSQMGVALSEHDHGRVSRLSTAMGNNNASIPTMTLLGELKELGFNIQAMEPKVHCCLFE
jgi:hypothetical protein